MISVDEQQKILLSTSRRLKKKINAYAIGGTAMMFLGLKEATLDIDLVFENEKDRNIFKEAARSIGYAEIDSVKIYVAKRNQPEMLMLGDSRLDMFVNNVINFVFSEGMRKRAEQMHQFHNNLVLKIADSADILFMKCATDRLKDIDDAREIINSGKVKWNVIVDEAETQIKLGNETAAFELGCFLEELRNRIRVKIPNETLDRLFGIVQKQIKKKQKP